MAFEIGMLLKQHIKTCVDNAVVVSKCSPVSAKVIPPLIGLVLGAIN